MKKEPTPSFICTLKLRYTENQAKHLDKIFQYCNNIYNGLVRDRIKAFDMLRETPEYKTITDAMSAIYQHESLSKKEQKEALKELGKERQELMQNAGISKYGFQHEIIRFRQQYGQYINSQVGKRIADTVWQKFEKYIFGDGKQIHFRKWNECRSIESSSPTQGIVFKGNHVMIGKGFNIKVKLDNTDYERECLSHRIKYCRIIRIPWKKGWLYKLQLVLEGTPPVIRNKNTGKPKHPMGKGRVGLDIGMKDIAVVGDNGAMVPELVPNDKNITIEIAQLQQKLDRMRRQANPDFYDEKGCIVPINKLPPERLNKYGKRIWLKSNRYKRLEQRLRYLHSKLARIRKYSHQELANKIVAMGNVFFIEKMRWQALAKKAKLEKNDKGRYKRRQRFGKSILSKAPATLVNMIQEKVTRLGGVFYEVKTWETKASQYNHLTKDYKKVPLSQRWKIFDYNAGKYILQRDLYSAFLLSCTNKKLDGFKQKECESKFSKFISHHERAVRARKLTDASYQRSYDRFVQQNLGMGQMRLDI